MPVTLRKYVGGLAGLAGLAILKQCILLENAFFGQSQCMGIGWEVCDHLPCWLCSDVGSTGLFQCWFEKATADVWKRSAQSEAGKSNSTCLNVASSIFSGFLVSVRNIWCQDSSIFQCSQQEGSQQVLPQITGIFAALTVGTLEILEESSPAQDPRLNG